jgi:hypothetical protein
MHAENALSERISAVLARNWFARRVQGARSA